MSVLAPSKPVVFLQERCAKHRYIRNKDTSTIVERPERLRAVHLGLAAAVARVEVARGIDADAATPPQSPPVFKDGVTDMLADALGKMGIADGAGYKTPPTTTSLLPDPLVASLELLTLNNAPGPAATSTSVPGPSNAVVELVRSNALVDLCTHPAVDFIHGDEEPKDNPLLKLREAVSNCVEKIKDGQSEVPVGLNQEDLYLCPDSLEAISSAVGTVCEAVDRVSTGTSRKAFVAIRPPGHHADEATPSGFCWVNNVAIGAAHAHLQHNISHVIVLDIDLHHGNGTQAIAWRINEDAYRQTLESEAQQSAGQPGASKAPLQFYYGSLHDILSYPCEDGKVSLVAAASVKIAGPHGQHVENIHLDQYDTLDDFWRLYDGPYARLLDQAEHFCRTAKAKPENTLVFISCGFDACEHEHASMSRHGRHVPVAFYARFARDAAVFADKFAAGKIVSVLEGGYSDRALASGAFAHLVGLAAPQPIVGEDQWWSMDNLVKIEKLLAAKKGRKSVGTTKPEPWLERTTAVFAQIDVKSPAPLLYSQLPTPTRSLRSNGDSKTTSPSTKGRHAPPPAKKQQVAPSRAKQAVSLDVPRPESPLTEASDDDPLVTTATKKLPRVILHVRPPPSSSSAL